MAAVTAQNGVIVLAFGDTFTAKGSQSIWAIVVVDDSGGTSGTLTDSDSNVLFEYTNGGAAAVTTWYGIQGCVSTGNGLVNSVADATLYVYIK